MAFILKWVNRIEKHNLNFNTMTLLKVYNKNGYRSPVESNVFGLNEMLNEFPFLNLYPNGPGSYSPRVNIREEKEHFLIEMEAAGIDKDHLKIDVSKDLLTISFQADENVPEDNFTLKEFDLRSFERSFRLPESINKEKINASFRNGILYLNLPKKKEAIDKGPRSIEIA